MMDYPSAAFLTGSPIGGAPKKKRSMYASVFDKFVPGGGDYSDEDKDKLARQGLLNLGLTMLQTGGGFGNALGAGVQGGLLAMNQGADDLTNDRYRKSMMARTTAGMDRNTQTEALMRETVRPDGTLDQAKYSQLASVDPEKAKALRDAIDGPKTKWQMGQIGDGAGGTIDVLFDPADPSNIRTIDGQPIGPGAQAQQPQGPTGGARSLLDDAANSVAPDMGMLSQAVMAQESGGNPNAVSPKGALGTMQTMPGTLLDPGFGVQPAASRDPAEMERVGKDYLQAMTQKYGVEGGLAAYNWGPGNWEAALASSGGDPRAALAKAPQETRKYVPAVLNRVGGGRASALPKNVPMIGRRPAKPTAGADGDKAANWQIVQGQDGTFYRVNKLTGETASAGVQGANALRQRDQDQKRAETLSQVNGTIESIDATIQQLNTVAQSPGLGAGVGLTSMLPAVPGSSRKDFDANLATLKAQNFIPMVSQLKGMGALSDAEGKKLTEAIGALDPGMSEKEFSASLDKIKSRLLLARAAASRRVGALKQNTVNLSGDTGATPQAAADPLGIL